MLEALVLLLLLPVVPLELLVVVPADAVLPALALLPELLLLLFDLLVLLSDGCAAVFSALEVLLSSFPVVSCSAAASVSGSSVSVAASTSSVAGSSVSATSSVASVFITDSLSAVVSFFPPQAAILTVTINIVTIIANLFFIMIPPISFSFFVNYNITCFTFDR